MRPFLAWFSTSLNFFLGPRQCKFSTHCGWREICPRELYNSNMFSIILASRITRLRCLSFGFDSCIALPSVPTKAMACVWNCGLIEDRHGHRHGKIVLSRDLEGQGGLCLGRWPAKMLSFLSNSVPPRPFTWISTWWIYFLFFESHHTLTHAFDVSHDLLLLWLINFPLENPFVDRDWVVLLQDVLCRCLKDPLQPNSLEIPTPYRRYGVPSKYAKTLSKSLRCQTLHI